MPVFCRNGVWRYQGRCKDAQGVKHRPSGTPTDANTRAAAVRAEREHINRILNPDKFAPDAVQACQTFAEFSAIYMAQGTTDQAESEVDGKRQRLKHLNNWIGHVPLNQIGRLELDKLRAELLKKKRAPSTINNYLCVVGAVLRYAMDCNLIAKRPKIGFLPIPPRTQPVYTEAEITAELKKCAGDIMQTCAILLGADAGLRAGEIRALRREHVELTSRRVKGKLVQGGWIHVTESNYKRSRTSPKSGKLRKVPITPILGAALHAAMMSHAAPTVLVRTHLARAVDLEWLRAHVAAHPHASINDRRKDWAAAPGGQQVSMGAMFNALHANAERAFRNSGMPWTKEVMRARQPAKGWHALRHSFCTRLVARGMDVRTIQRLAGHADIKTTEGYWHDEPNADAVVMALDGSL